MSGSQYDRIIAIIGMMGASMSDEDGTGVNAYRQATRLLKEQGLTWRDVAQRAFTNAPDRWNKTAPPAAPTAPSPAPAPPPGKPAPKERLSGSDIPVTITGTIRALDDERQAVKKQMLLIDVETDGAIYGPIVAYAGTLMDNILRNRNRRAMLRVRPTRDGRQMPQVVGCSPM